MDKAQMRHWFEIQLILSSDGADDFFMVNNVIGNHKWSGANSWGLGYDVTIWTK